MIEIKDYPQLTEAQRIQARKQARENLFDRAGGEPQFSEFENRECSLYSPEIELFVARAIWVLFFAAFMLSATHVFKAAYDEYAAVEGVSPLIVMLTGCAFVLLADIAAIVFLMAPAVYGHVMSTGVKRMAYCGAFLSSFVSVIFNVAISIQFTDSPLDWVVQWFKSFATNPTAFWVATLPPLFVWVVGNIQKTRILAENAQRHSATVNYNTAIQEWKQWAAHIEDDPQWVQAWASALWDAWAHRKRRDVLAKVTVDVKRALVEREMLAENWWDSRGIPTESAERSSKKRNSVKGLVDSVEYDGTLTEKVAYLMLVDYPELLQAKRSVAQTELGVGSSTLYGALGLIEDGWQPRTNGETA